MNPPPAPEEAASLPAWRLEAERMGERFRAAQARHQIDLARQERDTLIRSTTWRATAPLRHAIAALPPALRAGLGRGARLFFPASRASAPEGGRPAPGPSEDAACEVSILIVSRDAVATTRCVPEIRAATEDTAHEILIADIADDPDGRLLLQRLAAGTPGVRLVPLGPRRQSGEANNILAEQARGRLLALLHPEAVVPPGWLRRLCLALASRPLAGAVGPVLASPGGVAAGHAVDGQGRLTPMPPAAGMARVDHLPAAALLLPRRLFLEAGGFDLAFEPGGHEDVDLSFRLAARGAELWACPEVVVALDEAADADTASEIAREKFIARWGQAARDPAPRRRALLFSPYELTPGGGERYILTLAAALSRDHEVVFAGLAPYSLLRLRNMGAQLGIDLEGCATTTLDALETQPPWDLMIAMGNEPVPPIAALARRNLFICQFPFPPATPPDASGFAGYEGVIVYSDFVGRELRAALVKAGLPEPPIRVLPPPVPRMPGLARAKKPMILSVGRFFATGHNKRHDLLIDAFAELLRHHGEGISLHLAGSLALGPEHLAHLDMLRARAKGLPVEFHVDCTARTLRGLYRDAALYWHGTGLGVDLRAHPGQSEHFGIAIAEAMSAQCVTFAVDAGGAPEIIADGRDGFLYADAATLVETSLRMLAPGGQADRIRIGEAAGQRARAFSPEVFAELVEDLAADGAAEPLSLAAAPAPR